MKSVEVIIPAWNEEKNIHRVIDKLLETKSSFAEIRSIIVVDNNSTDNTADVALRAGASVVREGKRGYGQACLTGIANLSKPDVVLFIDGDGSDFPEEWPDIVKLIADDKCDLVVGSRNLGKAESDALLPQARFGNLLATSLMKFIYNSPFSDLGPFRAISYEKLEYLQMADLDFGWTVEMQLKALRYNLRCSEVSVSYRKRHSGKSKVTGTLTGTFFAAKKILSLVGLEYLYKLKKFFSSNITEQSYAKK
ncbi:MAG: glycosyltransferase family 2 protein [Deltaproteobacteria bacterium]|nr:glycosyltransferase family 2 protein [Deltaproteobacteria bacterium]